MSAAALQGGFAQPSHDAARAFRAVLSAMARPGRIETALGAMPPAPLSPAAGAVLLTLCDPETPVFLAGDADTPEVRAWIGFHLGAPLVGPAQAAFVVGTWEAVQPLSTYAIGASEYPDRSATIIVEIPRLEPEGTRLTGPGIREEAALSLPETEAFRANAARFPLGLDFIFTSGTRLAGLPRTTRVG